MSIGENSWPGTLVSDVRVSDEDFYDLIPAPTGNLTFEIMNEEHSTPFSINSKGIRMDGTDIIAVNVSVAAVSPGNSVSTGTLPSGTPVCSDINIDFDVEEGDVAAQKAYCNFKESKVCRLLH